VLIFYILSITSVEEADDGNDSYEARAIKRKIARKKAQEIAARAQVSRRNFRLFIIYGKGVRYLIYLFSTVRYQYLQYLVGCRGKYWVPQNGLDQVSVPNSTVNCN
jgi:hypothetical protein